VSPFSTPSRAQRAPYAPLAGHVAFYAGRMDACFVDGERVTPQPGGFYGGWITSTVTGAFRAVPAPGPGDASVQHDRGR
jgi:hypothetical protein